MAFSSSVRAVQAKPAAARSPSSSRRATVTRASNQSDAPSSLASVASRIVAATASGLILMVGSQPAMSAVLPAAPIEIAQTASYTDPLGGLFSGLGPEKAQLPSNVSDDLANGPKKAGKDLQKQAAKIGRGFPSGKLQQAADDVSSKAKEAPNAVSGFFQDVKSGASKIAGTNVSDAVTDKVSSDINITKNAGKDLQKQVGNKVSSDISTTKSTGVASNNSAMAGFLKDIKSSGGSTGENLQDNIESTAKAGGSKMQSLSDVADAGSLGRNVQQAGDAVSDKVSGDISTAKGVGKDLQQQASDLVPSSAGFKIEQAAGSVSDKAEEASGGISGLIDTVKDNIKSAAKIDEKKGQNMSDMAELPQPKSLLNSARSAFESAIEKPKAAGERFSQNIEAATPDTNADASTQKPMDIKSSATLVREQIDENPVNSQRSLEDAARGEPDAKVQYGQGN